MYNKSCFTCRNAIIYHGHNGGLYEPPESTHMEECRAENMTKEAEEKCENIDWDEEKCPNICGCYNPVIIDSCTNCKKTINTPLFEHKWFANLYESLPVCSENCKKDLENKFQKEIFDTYH